VYSEVIASPIFAECLREAGILPTVEQAMAFDVGRSATTLGAAVEQEFRRLLPGSVIEHVRARIVTCLVVKGVDRILAVLPLPRCIASSSQTSNAASNQPAMLIA